YLVSVTLWLAVTGALYLRVGYHFLKQRAGLVAFLAYPAAFYNAAHGQNAFLTTALFGGGVLALNRRPILAGVLFGSLAIKPHLGLLVPIALLAGRRWTTFLAATATVIALVLLSLAIFGAETWHGFFAIARNARGVLESGSVGYAKLVSLFAALRLAGAPVGVAYGAQALIALAAAAALAFLIGKNPRAESGGITLIAATPLASPFLLDYDLTLLALPIAWLVRQGARHGFLPWEKLILLAAFVLVLIARYLATVTGIAIAPLVIAALFAAVMRRGLAARE
ncbi:MAG: glycosyltransferase family 87 protein, partial [Alphaproteobacteria bacterium]